MAGLRLPRASLFFASPKKSKQKKGKDSEAGFGLLAELLSFASPKESNQRKGEPKAAPLRGALRYSRRAGSGANSLRSNSARPDPRAAALLSTANGPGGPQYRVCSFAALTWHTLAGTLRAGRALLAQPRQPSIH